MAFKVLKVDRRFKAVDWAGKHSLFSHGVHTRHYNDGIEFSWSDWMLNSIYKHQQLMFAQNGSTSDRLLGKFLADEPLGSSVQ